MNSKSNKKGFTLIELLVVIAIIALLLSIIIPALSKVKEQAKSTICKTRLKELILAVHVYESETGSLPMNSFMSSDGTPVSAGAAGGVVLDYRWFNILAPYVGRQNINDVAERRNIASDYELFRCPTQDYLTRLFKEWDGVSAIYSPKTGAKLHNTGTGAGIYGYNVYFRGTMQGGLVYTKSSQVKIPAELPLIADLAAEAPEFLPAKDMVSGYELNAKFPHPLAYEYGWNMAGDPRNPLKNWEISGPAPNHKSDKITYSFLDGHVEAMDGLWPWTDKSDFTTSRAKYFHPKRSIQ